MGGTLGGRPEDPGCYADGVGANVRGRAFFERRLAGAPAVPSPVSRAPAMSRRLPRACCAAPGAIDHRPFHGLAERELRLRPRTFAARACGTLDLRLLAW